MSARILVADSLIAMGMLSPASVDAVVCDPPYGLAFMGKAWDHGVPGVPFWEAAHRVAKPGAYLLAFGGTRTYHRLTCAIEDAGWEIRDCLSWLYGSGFPKSLDVSKAIDKAAHAAPLWDEIRAHVRHWRDLRGYTNPTLNEALGLATNGAGMARHWTSEVGGQHSIPSKEQWGRLRELLGWPACALDAVYDAVKDGAERPIVGQQDATRLAVAPGQGADRSGVTLDVTAAATDLARQWDGWGTALKPAWEPIILARKPLVGTVAVNVTAHGTGALNIDGCRVEVTDAAYAKNCSGDRGHADNRSRDLAFGMGCGKASDGGRWPANVVLDEDAAALLDAQSGTLTSGANPTRRGSNKFANTYGDFVGQEQCEPARGVDVGGASRFYYCAKASRSERNAGVKGAAKPLNWSAGTQNPGAFQSPNTDRSARNHHPTVKPLALMRWLCRLVTPPGGLILDPFTGSGSTGCAAVAEGFGFLGIELHEEYAAIARARIAHHESLIVPDLFADGAA